jgi:hypothetical protein
MKTQRRFGLLTLFLTILVGAMVLAPCVSAQNQISTDLSKQVDPATDIEGYVPVDVINIDPVIKNATPYFGMLVLSEEGKKNFVASLDATGNASKQDLSALQKGLLAIWGKYPVTLKTVIGDTGYPSYGGTITTISFKTDARNVMLTDEENDLLKNIQSAVIGSDQNAIPLWGGTPSHERISYWAAQKCLFPYPATVASSAPVPDTWYEWAPYPFNQLFHSLSHYYNPYTGIGGAPQQTRDYENTAKSSYDLGPSYYTQAATYLGYSSHFLEDVGNPMHTGYEGQQILNQWTHSNFENHVNSRWNSGFESLVANNYNYFWYTDWRQGTVDLSVYSNGYLDSLYTRIYNLGPSWNYANPDTTVDSIANNVILRTAKYTNGLARYAIA